MQLSDIQIRWLLFNIHKDREEKYKTIEIVLNALKMYINSDMYKKEQEMKKDGLHKTELDNVLKQQFKDKGLSNEQLKQIESFFQ